MYNFNKTELAFFPMQAMLHKDLLFFLIRTLPILNINKKKARTIAIE